MGFRLIPIGGQGRDARWFAGGVVSRRRVGQRRLRLGGGTHTSLVGHVLKGDRSWVLGCSMSGYMRLRARILTTFTCLCRSRRRRSERLFCNVCIKRCSDGMFRVRPHDCSWLHSVLFCARVPPAARTWRNKRFRARLGGGSERPAPHAGMHQQEMEDKHLLMLNTMRLGFQATHTANTAKHTKGTKRTMSAYAPCALRFYTTSTARGRYTHSCLRGDETLTRGRERRERSSASALQQAVMEVGARRARGGVGTCEVEAGAKSIC